MEKKTRIYMMGRYVEKEESIHRRVVTVIIIIYGRCVRLRERRETRVLARTIRFTPTSTHVTEEKKNGFNR